MLKRFPNGVPQLIRDLGIKRRLDALTVDENARRAYVVILMRIKPLVGSPSNLTISLEYH